MGWFLELLFEVLFGWWWYGQDGRTKTANAADPLLVLVGVVAVVVLVLVLALLATR